MIGNSAFLSSHVRVELRPSLKLNTANLRLVLIVNIRDTASFPLLNYRDPKKSNKVNLAKKQ